ncbi:MAG TPA: VRR-NUC domain-containing protein [Spirochaetes bacterium]|nr:VRR-NUC domain-containing protein [Spirochaetota bacterium]
MAAKLESLIESRFCRYAARFDIDAIKIYKRGWPDRLVSLKNGYGFYIEFKGPNGEIQLVQAHVHRCLRKKGFHVYICDNFEDAVTILNYELEHYNTDTFLSYDDVSSVLHEV